MRRLQQILLLWVGLTFAANGQTVPTYFPATLFDTNLAQGSTHKRFAGTSPAEFSGRFTGVCRIKVRVNVVDFFGNPVLDAGQWISDPRSQLEISQIDDGNEPLHPNASAGCNRQATYFATQYFQSVFVTGGNTYKGWLRTQGAAPAYYIPFNFLNEPANNLSVRVHFAPVFGLPQIVEFKYDNVQPQVFANITETHNVEEIVGNWARPIVTTTNNWLNLSHLRDAATVGPGNVLRVQLHDPETVSGLFGSGIWKAKAVFDDIADENINNTTGYVPLDQCNIDTSISVRPALATHPKNPCTISQAAFPTEGVARQNGTGGAADDPFEIWFRLNWGNNGGSDFKSLGSYADGQHAASLWFRDMANNENTVFYLFNTDRYAPCDNATNTHSCNMTFTDSSMQPIGIATSDGNIRVDIQILEGSGSGIASDGSVDPNLYLYVGHLQPNPANMRFITPTGADGGNWNVQDLAAQDLNCDSILQNNTSPLWTSVIPHTQENYDIGTGTSMSIPVDLSGAAEGAYWFFVCALDRAGNWSTMIIPGTSNLENNVNPNRVSNLVNLSNFNPDPASFPSHNYDAGNSNQVITNALVPAFRSRLMIDRPTSDDNPGAPDSCATDPCVTRVLNPQPVQPQGAESNIRIAYSPPAFSGSTSVLVGVKLPPDNSGIKTLYWSSGSASGSVDRSQQTSDDCLSVIAANGQPTPAENDTDGIGNDNGICEAGEVCLAGWVDFCFTATGVSGNTLDVWLEDNAGNNNTNGGRATRNMFIDTTPSAPPFNLNSTPNPTLNPTPILTFDPPTDPSGISHYLICYWQFWAGFGNNELLNLHNNVNGSCPSSTLLLGRTSYTVSNITHQGAANDNQSYQLLPAQGLTLGRWDFAIYAVDNSGNISAPSAIYSIAISTGSSSIAFTGESSDYSLGGVSPRIGSSGQYQFRVRYFDATEVPPTTTQVWIDQNGNNLFEASERFNMSFDQKSNNGFFADGEDYTLKENLTYNPATKGKLRYRFFFENPNGASVNSSTNGDATANNSIQLDPYDLASFDGMMQIRNNVVRPGFVQYPTILLKPPGPGNSQIKVTIHGPDGKLIKEIINSAYSSSTRFVRWNLTGENGNTVSSGVYTAVYTFGNERAYKKIIVVR